MDIRAEATSIMRAYRNILVITSQLSRSERVMLDEKIGSIPFKTSKELRFWRKQYAEALKDISRFYGVRANRQELEMLATGTVPGEEIEEGYFGHASKWVIDNLLANSHKLSKRFCELPPHGKICIDVHGIFDVKGQSELFLLEASLFEDMAALWNEVWLHRKAGENWQAPPQERKRLRALIRATVKAVFSLIEGYLNGLAIDILVSQSLSENESVLLREKDGDRNKPQSLRNKLLSYPRIVVGSQHPLFDENTCSDMKTLLNLEQTTRHALIHPKVGMYQGELREEAYNLLSLEQTAAACDCVIALIKTIASSIHEKFGPVGWWLHERNADGLYPENAFV